MGSYLIHDTKFNYEVALLALKNENNLFRVENSVLLKKRTLKYLRGVAGPSFPHFYMGGRREGTNNADGSDTTSNADGSNDTHNWNLLLQPVSLMVSQCTFLAWLLFILRACDMITILSFLLTVEAISTALTSTWLFDLHLIPCSKALPLQWLKLPIVTNDNNGRLPIFTNDNDTRPPIGGGDSIAGSSACNNNCKINRDSDGGTNRHIPYCHFEQMKGNSFCGINRNTI